MKKNIVWKQYRDETKRTLPEKLADLAKSYKDKTGVVPTVIGLPSGYGEETWNALSKRFKVLQVVPNWAKHEIWLGMEVDDASL